MILEVKVVKAGTDDVVYHQAHVIACERFMGAAATLADIIEEITGCDLDEDDKADVMQFGVTGEQLASRFGGDWEFYVEAIVTSFDECDIDPEFDSIVDKYSLSL